MMYYFVSSCKILQQFVGDNFCAEALCWGAFELNKLLHIMYSLDFSR